MRRLIRLPYNLLRFLSQPWWTVLAMLRRSVGQEYGISFFTKVDLLRKMWRNAHQPGSASVFFEHVFIIMNVLQVPKNLPGAVAEFGCFKGLSTASLSLACVLTDRRLLVFDSFEGLPAPEESVHNLGSGRPVAYRKGEFAGALEEVRANVSRFGDIRVCEFIKGYFQDTLADRSDTERFVLIFEDADLPESVRSVLVKMWKKLQPGCSFFCHEARDREVVHIFFDKQWWNQFVGEAAPGFVGSGVGMMGGPGLDWCCLGFAVRPEPPASGARRSIAC